MGKGFLSPWWIFLLIFNKSVYGQFGNSPPIIQVARTWEIPDSENEGSVITRVTAFDAENDPLTFDLEKHHAFFNTEVPFAINAVSGVVTANQSLHSRGGEKFLVYVTVNDGHMTSKNEVYVKIVNTSATTPRGEASKPPLIPLYRPQNAPPDLPIPKHPPPPRKPYTTSATKEKTEEKSVQDVVKTSSTTTKTTTTTTTATTTTAAVPVSTGVNTTTMSYTVIPIAIVCSVVVSLSLVAFLFRKRICKYRNKLHKEDLRKASSAASEDPLALQHWRGPRALSNRYEGWNNERPNQPPPIQSDRDSLKATDKWEFPRHHLKVFNILGEGCFGQVWRCEAFDIDGKPGPLIVAVKTLKENATEKERTDLLQELEVMKSLEPHPNVVRLLGCCTEKDPLFVIMEFVALGKLQSFLRNSRAERYYGNMHGQSETLTSRDLTAFAYQCARGMDFLSNKGIIHRDLAARNILVNEDRICKVADFGFARDIVDRHTYERKSEGRLPIRWMAPESLYDNIFSVKSDVWSFGVLLWEIVTLGSTPYPGLAAADVMRKVREGYRLEKPEHCRREIYNIMFYCWDKDPAERPSFPEIVTMLGSLLLTETEYIQLEQFPDHCYYNMVSLSGEKL